MLALGLATFDLSGAAFPYGFTFFFGARPPVHFGDKTKAFLSEHLFSCYTHVLWRNTGNTFRYHP